MGGRCSATSPYTKEMYTEFLRYAYEHDTEFVTLLDLAERIKAFEKAGSTTASTA